MDTWREDVRTGHTHEPGDVTVELDGLGRKLSELPTDTRVLDKDSEEEEVVELAGAGPVFVDATGRRGKKIRRAGWGIAIVCTCFAGMVGVSLVGGNSTAPFLKIPIPGIAQKGKPDAVVPAPGGKNGPSASTGVAPADPSGVPAIDANGNPVPRPSGSGSAGIPGGEDNGATATHGSGSEGATSTGGSKTGGGGGTVRGVTTGGTTGTGAGGTGTGTAPGGSTIGGTDTGTAPGASGGTTTDPTGGGTETGGTTTDPTGGDAGGTTEQPPPTDAGTTAGSTDAGTGNPPAQAGGSPDASVTDSSSPSASEGAI